MIEDIFDFFYKFSKPLINSAVKDWHLKRLVLKVVIINYLFWSSFLLSFKILECFFYLAAI